jgi:anti-sigma factor RsiW
VEHPTRGISSPIGHPTVEELSAYHLDRLTTEDAARLEFHLDRCPSCAELLSELAEFEPTNDMAERVEGRAAADRVLAQVKAYKWRRRAALAASLLFLAFGTWFWTLRRLPTGPIPEFEVTPAVRDSAQEILLPTSARRFRLILLGSSRSDDGRWMLSALDSRAKEVARVEGLAPDRNGTLRAEFEARAFPTGSYRFRLVREGPDPSVAEDFYLRFRLTP